MGVFEALVLLSIGLLLGIGATLFDVILIGAASFITHFALWVLVNTLLAIHVESRIKAIWWSIPYNLGYIEAYFITTAASYEGFSKSLAVPLAAAAFIAPLLVNALWSARRDKGVFGRALSVAIVVGTLVASYLINGALSWYDGVACVCIALLLTVAPAKRLRITRAKRVEVDAFAEGEVTAAEGVFAAAPEAWEAKSEPTPRKSTKRWGKSARKKRAEKAAAAVTEAADPMEEDRAALRPTKRKGGGMISKVTSFSSRRKQRAAEREARDLEAREREERAREASQHHEPFNDAPQQNDISFDDAYSGMSTLGTARTARPSTRSRRY